MSTSVIITAIICVSMVLIMAVGCVTNSIDKYNHDKWRANNPEAFKDEEVK